MSKLRQLFPGASLILVILASSGILPCVQACNTACKRNRLANNQCYKNALNGDPELPNFLLCRNAFLLPGATFPASFATMTSLERIELDNAQMVGTIPPEIGLLTDLNWLEIANNAFTGGIPTQFGKLTRLNVLSGSGMLAEAPTTLPSEVGKMTNLFRLDLKGNKIEGTVPTQIGELVSLTSLLLNCNSDTCNNFEGQCLLKHPSTIALLLTRRWNRVSLLRRARIM